MLFTERRIHFISAFQPIKEEIPPSLSRDLTKASEFKGFCSKCRKPAKDHLIYQGQFICPDCYIIYENGIIVNIVEAKIFEETYKPLCDRITDVEIVGDDEDRKGIKETH